MTGWADHLRGRTRRSELGLWTGAAILVLTVHVGGVAWALREPPITAADNSPPPAIMIELAPTSEAVQTEANEVAPDETVTQEVQSETLEPVKDPTPDVKPEPIEKVEEETTQEPTPEEPTEEPEENDTLEKDVLAKLDNVEVPLPVSKPPPKTEVVKEEPKKKPVQKRKKPAPASKQRLEAQAQVTESNRNAAAAAASGSASSASPAQWQSRLMSHLERRKRYPPGSRSRGETGVAYVRFRIDDAGNVLSASLARSSGFSELDTEVVDLVRRASPVPAPPPGVAKTITAPVRFSVR
ncbi:MAG: TonB family protein [Pseudomonadota bacterium]